jgi:transposase
VDQVHVIRHNVLVEGRSARQVAKELGISRRTVRKYLTEAAPIGNEAQPRRRPSLVLPMWHHTRGPTTKSKNAV